ncbi:MAG: hypothetical protein CMI01_00165 [Oceanospirillaceae bacterium]|nr:hypothetical protein [Oceanospirillaceae bacterium]
MCQIPTTGSRATSTQSICNAARSFKGTPYKHQGRTPGAGLDCIGLVMAAHQTAGIEFDLPTDYSRVPRPALLLKHLGRYCHTVPVQEMAAGDILLLKLRHYPQHLALYVGENSIVHSYQAARKVIEQELDPRTRKMIHSVHRLKEWDHYSA